MSESRFQASPEKPIRVGFNGRFLASTHPTGTHRSALGFLGALSKKPDLKVAAFVPACSNAELTDQIPRTVSLQPVGVNNPKLLHIWEQLQWPREDSCDVYVDPLGTTSFVKRNDKHVLVVHDLNVLHYPKNYTFAFRMWQRFSAVYAAQRARHIVCFSEYVKRDIVARLNIPDHTIHVVPQGPGIQTRFDRQTETKNIRSFVCTGSMQPHKNLQRILKAWEISGLASNGFKLVLVGKRQAGFKSAIDDERLLTLPGVESTGVIDDSALQDLYQNATALVYPSIAEGFGLPLVEAFHLGCPVITSNASCLPEIAGNAALLVDPHSEQEIANAMTTLASNEPLRHSLAEAGHARAAIYSWENAGNQLRDVIVNVFRHNSKE